MTEENEKSCDMQNYHFENTSKVMPEMNEENIEVQDPGTEDVNEILYGEKARERAVSNLLLFSILLFTLPFVVMYLAYRYFIDQAHLSPDGACLYAGIMAAITVCVIVAIFAWVAYNEECMDSDRIYKMKEKTG